MFDLFQSKATTGATDPISEEQGWRAQIADLKTFDFTNRAEWALRYSIVFGGMVVATLANSDLNILWLLSGYFAFDLIYLFVLYVTPSELTRRQYWLLIATNCAGHICYSLCAAYLFWLGGAANITIAIAATASFALYTIVRYQRINPILISDWVQLFSLTICIGLWPLTGIETWPARFLVLLSTFGTASYLIFAQSAMLRTRAQLAEARGEVVQAQKLQAVGKLTAGVAHDFNNLLTVINGNIELAQLTDDPQERAERMVDAQQATKRAGSVTTQLLAYSRKARLIDAEIDLQTFVENFHETVGRILPAGVKFGIDGDPRLKTLYCDPEQLQTALFNLVMNACDALENKGEITVGYKPADVEKMARLKLNTQANGAYGVISVADTGPGIPPALRADIFQPFYTTKPAGEGSGLGLSMATGFAQQSGGGLLLDSSPGGGATFSLVLPARQR